jgi:hypothetical protein
MRKTILLCSILLLFGALLFAVSDTGTLNVRGYFNYQSDPSKKYLNLSITDTGKKDVSSGDTLTVPASCIDAYGKVFEWSMIGNVTRGVKISFTVSSFKNSNDSSVTIPCQMKFDPSYTFLNASYLGSNGATISGTLYKDTQSWSNLTTNPTGTTEETTTGSYSMSPASSLQWQRNGIAYVSVSSADIEKVIDGTYQSTVSVTVKMV